MSRAVVHLERAGFSTVAVVSSGFIGMFDALCASMGVDDMPRAEYPGLIPTDTTATLREKVASILVPRLLDALGSAPRAHATDDVEPDPTGVVFRGDLDAVHEHFAAQLWSDGLPIIPPTPDRVERFLACTSRSPDEVLGIVPAQHRAATVRNTAVNGVMAGCRPEHMPVLVAAVEAVCDPRFRLEDAGSTPSWEPLVIVSGPGVRRLGLNTGAGLLKVGAHPNTSIGRFLRLYIRNITGIRTESGIDKGTVGFTFNVALAEDDEALADVGWAPSRLESGFHLDDTVVTVQSTLGSAGPLYSSGATAEEHVEAIVQIAASTCGGWAAVGLARQHWHPLLILNPSIAALLARQGWTKERLRQHLCDEARVPARWMNRTLRDAGLEGTTLESLVAAGQAPGAFADTPDPDRLVPVFTRPEWIGVVVTGDPSRNQSRFLINNHNQGVPVSKRVDW